MDINSLQTQYLNQTTNDKSAQKLKSSLTGDYSKATDDELMNVCKEFESYFIEQMFKEMQKSVPKSESGDSSTNSLVDYFKDNLVQEYAKNASDQGNYGLAQNLYEQMKRNYSL
jgi:flagellar protein FlgJ